MAIYKGNRILSSADCACSQFRVLTFLEKQLYSELLSDLLVIWNLDRLHQLKLGSEERLSFI